MYCSLPLADILLSCYGDECSVANGNRELCMYDSVSQSVCENEGCCYDTAVTPNCYNSKNESK